jgi:hypothetical protein
MEWVLPVALLLLLLGLVFLFASLIAPRCPICVARMQPHDCAHTLFQWHGWETCWRNYVCPQCLFRQDYLRIVRRSKDPKYETRTVH